MALLILNLRTFTAGLNVNFKNDCSQSWVHDCRANQNMNNETSDQHTSIMQFAVAAGGIVELLQRTFCRMAVFMEGPITDEQVWANDSYARGVLNNAYFTVPDEFDLMEMVPCWHQAVMKRLTQPQLVY